MSLGGVALRPSGSDSHWPPPGTKVPWRPCVGVQNLYDQSYELSYPMLGVLGNLAHLRKHGDHTPWSAGKQVGIVYAIDLDMPDAFGDWLLAMCRSSYRTVWLDFWNFRGRQYSASGQDQGANPDDHFHCSFGKGYESESVTLLRDFAASEGKTMNLDDVTIDNDISILTGGGYKPGQKVPFERLVEVIFQRSDNASRDVAQLLKSQLSEAAELGTLKNDVAALKAAVTGLAAAVDTIAKRPATGGPSAEEVVAALLDRLKKAA